MKVMEEKSVSKDFLCQGFDSFVYLMRIKYRKQNVFFLWKPSLKMKGKHQKTKAQMKEFVSLLVIPSVFLL